MPLALLALAVGAFGIGTTELAITGSLPRVAGDFGVSIPAAGLLVTSYTLGVVIGAPLLTVLGAKVSRKKMLLLLTALFVVGNLLSARAPAFPVMPAGRIVASLAHGAFFGIGAVVAAELVAPERKAGVVVMMFTGLTVANVVGTRRHPDRSGDRLARHLLHRLRTRPGRTARHCKLVPDLPKPEGVRLRHELAPFKNAQCSPWRSPCLASATSSRPSPTSPR